MLQIIWRKIFGPGHPKRHARAKGAPRRSGNKRPALRRLGIESLESRKLLSASGLLDGGFEAPALAATAYQIAPNGSAWTFSGIAGVSSNGSGFTTSNTDAPEGSQVGFVKNNGSISQQVYFSAGVYNISLVAAQRASYQTQGEEFEVLVDGANEGVIDPASATYASYQSNNFAVNAGMHSVEFLGLSPASGDSTAFLDEVSSVAVTDTVADAGFESPELAANTFATLPSGSPWRFSGTAGIAANGSGFVTSTAGSQAAPDGNQVGYVQETGSISQTVYLDAGTYSVSFQAAQRAVNQTSYQEIEVLVDGTAIGTVDPANSVYASYLAGSMNVAAGAHTIEFLGLNPEGGDNTAFIDDVSLTKADSIADGDFNDTVLDAGSYVLDPASSAWEFSGAAGVSTDDSDFTSSNADSPAGGRVAILKDTGTISQVVQMDAGVYTLSFQAAQRANYQTQDQQIAVLVDGTQVDTITPSGSSYATYVSTNFTVATGQHTIELEGLSPATADSTAFVDDVALAPAVGTVVDGSFEQAVQAADGYTVAPVGTPWQFSGVAGVSAAGSAFTDGSPAAPEGTQVAFIKDGAAMSQSIDFSAGVYSVSFQAAQRENYQTQPEGIEVLVDGTAVSATTPTSSTYGDFETTNFSLTAGMHTIEFMGLSPSSADSTAFIDMVAITSASDALGDGGFETPVLAAAAYAVTPSGTPWQFTGVAGISTNDSGFTAGSAAAPAGAQVAMIKDAGSMSQVVYLDTGVYNVSFLAAQRAGTQTQAQVIEVLVDGMSEGTIVPSGTTYSAYATANFSVAAGTHTIEFLGLAPATADSTAFIDVATLTAVADTLGEGSFETPVLAKDGYQLSQSGTSWQFAGTAGISANNSAYTSGNSSAPAGNQVALLKDTASMSQVVYLDAGAYGISFDAAQRADYQTQDESIEVLVDGASIGTIAPASTTYTAYETANFSVTAGAHTIEFLGLAPTSADSTAFIDDVSLAAVSDTIADGSFETPALTAGDYASQATGSPWQFTGNAGIASNGSGFTDGSADAPGGSQAAYLKDGGGMSQVVELDAGVYNVSFQAAQRATDQTQNQEIEILVDGSSVGAITPAATTYANYETYNFSVGAGAHTIQFLGLASSAADSTALVDLVAISPVSDALADSSFENLAVGASAYELDPAGSPWAFSGLAGIASNSSDFTSQNPDAPDGSQVAVLKDGGSMTQTAYLDAGVYDISFQSAQRVAPQSQAQEIEVLVDGVMVSTIAPSSTVYGVYQTANFSVTAGAHAIEFLGLAPSTADSTALVDLVSLAPVTDALADGNFGSPGLAAAAYQMAPSGSSWAFAGTAGISGNGSAFTTGNPVAPDGSQVALLKGTGSISQLVYLDAGAYSVSFLAAQRADYQTGYQEIEILVDGSIVGTATPSTSDYGLYQTPLFTVSAGPHMIELVGLNPGGGDNTAFVDEVAIT